jgi:hypothetical protein
VVLNTSTLAHRCRRRGVHPIINLLSAACRVRYAPIATKFHDAAK